MPIAPEGPAGIIGLDDKWSALCPGSATSGYSVSKLDRNAPEYDVLPTRRVNGGATYREKMVMILEARIEKNTEYPGGGQLSSESRCICSIVPEICPSGYVDQIPYFNDV